MFKKVSFSEPLARTIDYSALSDSNVPTRLEAKGKYKWDLTRLYKDKNHFKADYDKVKNVLVPQFNKYIGKINSSSIFIEVMQLKETTVILKERLGVYAFLNISLDQTNKDAQELMGKASEAESLYLNATGFIEPEILTMDEKILHDFIINPDLKKYSFFLKKILNTKHHMTSKEENKILSMTRKLTESPSSIWRNVIYADYKFPVIRDNNGNDIVLDKLGEELINKYDADFRKKAYSILGKSYKCINNTLVSTLIAHINGNIFLARTNKYDSVLDHQLANHCIPKQIFDNMINSVNMNLDKYHKYLEVRRKVLDLSNLCYSDLTTPLTKELVIDIPYEDGIKIAKHAFEILGEDYLSSFSKIIEEGRVDVYADKYKMSQGAFASNAIGVSSYVLINYTNSFKSLQTLVHELGHAVNSDYRTQNESPLYYETTSFMSEITSIFNELLLGDYLITNSKTSIKRKFYIDNQLNIINKFLFNISAWSEIEKKAYDLAQGEEGLSTETLNKVALDTFKKYYGNNYIITEMDQYYYAVPITWYLNYYQFGYTTSIAAAYNFLDNIKRGETDAIAKYIKYLKTGTSDYPIDILKASGVDMTTSEPYEKLIKYYEELIEEFTLLS